MATICSICASTKGPFSQEPTGVSASPYFLKCQTCTENYSYLTFVGEVGRNPSPQKVKKMFYKCPGCGSLFYKAIPYAFSRFDVRECPGCHHPFPTEKDIEFPESSQGVRIVMTNGVPDLSSEELESIYEKLLKIQPNLTKAIDNILLVEEPKGRDVWVVCKGNDYGVEEALRWVLLKAVDRKVSFSSSGNYDLTIKQGGFKVLKQMNE